MTATAWLVVRRRQRIPAGTPKNYKRHQHPDSLGVYIFYCRSDHISTQRYTDYTSTSHHTILSLSLETFIMKRSRDSSITIIEEVKRPRVEDRASSASDEPSSLPLVIASSDREKTLSASAEAAFHPKVVSLTSKSSSIEILDEIQAPRFIYRPPPSVTAPIQTNTGGVVMYHPLESAYSSTDYTPGAGLSTNQAPSVRYQPMEPAYSSTEYTPCAGLSTTQAPSDSYSVPLPGVSSSPSKECYRIKDFHFLAKLGEGSFGAVFYARHVGQAFGDKPVAIKLVAKEPSVKEEQMKEAKIMTDLAGSVFVCKLYGTFQSPRNLFHVLEYLHISLSQYNAYRRDKRGEPGFHFYDMKTLFADMLMGIDHVHSRGYIHQDLKPDNVMVSSNGTAKLVDFGLAVPIDAPRGKAGTPGYWAPEVEYREPKFRGASDYWSLGALLYVSLHNRMPYKDYALDIDRPPIFDVRVPRDFKEVICGLLTFDPKARYSYWSVRQSNYFRDFDFIQHLHKSIADDLSEEEESFESVDTEPEVQGQLDDEVEDYEGSRTFFHGFNYIR